MARQAIGALGSAHSTVEELHLLAALVRGIGSENIDYRLRHATSAMWLRPARPETTHWLGTSIASLTERWTARWSSVPTCARITRCLPSACARPHATARRS